ncbi:sugar MFS transporter [Chryseobacterium indologenes]|uniref:Sugar MFS transporter n=2 Tax=Chryseobacterium indologenes TaxID=253 RepID=A0AAD0Z035_CHRID|nr:sugar MFS transporter [Chryseobacterium indologenes]AYZ36726.1 sugar MFS transporter [Chryseobacterium indologenes]AZB20131.1 sugar MFS transporter [Chryseobacterium indologenes]MBF6645505.1 sugar MFS transporter [Chryseobacterium indologenes]MBU3049249.1 sugar MFS transporter [Chryseobacterium indologenes]
MFMNKEVQPQSRNYTVPLITITLLFFMWGFITCMNDILIPYLKQLFNLTFFESMLVQFCFFGAYFIGSLIYFLISISKGDPINKLGYKKGILFGIFLAAFGCILFYPAATFSYYPLFLGALFILGLGFTVLQITANAYVSLLGSEESASSRLNMTQAFNAFGTTIAPVLGGHLIFEFFSSPDGSFSAVATRIPYLIFAGILLLVALLISRVKLPSFQIGEEEIVKGWGALEFSHLKFGVFAMFCYVGGEVAVGSFIISFLEQPQIMGFNEIISKNYLSLYWGGAMIGRFLGAISLNQSLSQGKKAVYMLGAAAAVFLVIFSIVNLTFAQISFFLVFIVLNFIAFFIGKAAPARTLSIFAAINVILLISAMVNHGELAMYSILGIGIFNSIMFSNIYTLAISGLGKYTSQGSSLVVMAILGGAIVPIFQGYLADQFGVQHSFIIPVFCYLVILIFGAYCTKYLSHVESTEAKSGH